MWDCQHSMEYSSYSTQILKHNLYDSQMRFGQYNSWSSPTMNVVCGVGSAHNKATIP